MPFISLLTDFGLEDPYAGIMKGVILSALPEVSIVDLSHHVDPQDLKAAAFLIDASYSWFPKKTVHVIVIDPGVGSSRAIVAMAAAGHFFLAPDNGVLTRVLENATVDALVRVENPHYFIHPVSRTFHGRDIFAPVAAYMAGGKELSNLGPPMPPSELARLELPVPHLSDADSNAPALVGEVVAIDRFGNLITNLEEKRLQQFAPARDLSGLCIDIGGHVIRGLSFAYQSVSPGELLALIGSRGFLEISVNEGNAGRFCRTEKGDCVRVSRLDSS